MPLIQMESLAVSKLPRAPGRYLLTREHESNAGGGELQVVTQFPLQVGPHEPTWMSTASLQAKYTAGAHLLMAQTLLCERHQSSGGGLGVAAPADEPGSIALCADE